jgi:hypothetical protein
MAAPTHDLADVEPQLVVWYLPPRDLELVTSIQGRYRLVLLSLRHLGQCLIGPYSSWPMY